MKWENFMRYYARKYKIERKARGGHINMPGIDAIGGSMEPLSGWHPNVMNAGKDGNADACIKCRRNKQSDVNKVMGRRRYTPEGENAIRPELGTVRRCA